MVLFLSLTILTSQARADGESCDIRAHECEKVLGTAKKLISAQKEVISAQDAEIQKRIELMQSQEAYIKDLESSKAAWYRNPFITIPLGIIGGAVLYKTLSK